MSKTGLLLSGGIDSMVCLSLLLEAKHRVNALHINFRQAAAEPERRAVQSLIEFFNIPLRVIRIDVGREFLSGEIPFRNAALIFTAAMSAGDSIDELAIGVHAGVPYPDCSEEFLEAVRRMILESSDRHVGLVAPLRTWHKQEILAFAREKNLPIDLTYSCEVGTTPPCGECLSCKDRANLPC